MKELYRFFSKVSLCLALIAAFAGTGETYAQSYTERKAVHEAPSTDVFTGSWYEQLPPGYDPNGSTLYPVIIFTHGTGEQGDGSSSALSLVLVNGPPKLVHNGTFPTSFTVNGHTFSFIVLSPQYNGEDVPATGTTAFVDYALAHYKIDPNRVYLTGLSAGGTPVWYYPALSKANNLKIAAVVPVSAHGALDGPAALLYAQNHMPVYATHNDGDPTVDVNYTITSVDQMNADGANPAAIKHIFTDAQHEGTHDAWSTTYDPNFRPSDIGGHNVYEWMLQYSRGTSSPLPVKLTSYTATATADGTQVEVDWTTAVEQNNKQFVIQRSADGKEFTALDSIASAASPGGGHSYAYTDRTPLRGNNFYRLTQVDLDGRTTYFDVVKVTIGSSTATSLRISPNPSSGMIYLDLVSAEQGLLQAVLTDVQGKVLQTWSFNKQGMSWSQSINLGNLPSGSYFIRVQGNTIREIRQFVRK